MAPVTKGLHHVGLATMDLDATIDFYERVLGMKRVIFDDIPLEDGGRMRHVFFDVGYDDLIAFMESKGINGIPDKFETGINEGLGTPPPFFHYAFEAGTVQGLEERRQNLIAHNIKVSDVTDHDWCKSIYFEDPVNGVQLEYCVLTRDFTEQDAKPTHTYPANSKTYVRRLNEGFERAPSDVAAE